MINYIAVYLGNKNGNSDQAFSNITEVLQKSESPLTLKSYNRVANIYYFNHQSLSDELGCSSIDGNIIGNNPSLEFTCHQIESRYKFKARMCLDYDGSDVEKPETDDVFKEILKYLAEQDIPYCMVISNDVDNDIIKKGYNPNLKIKEKTKIIH